MIQHRIFPERDAEFSLYFHRVVNYLYGTDTPDPTPPSSLPFNTIRLGMNIDSLTPLWKQFNEWADVFPKSQNPDVRTRAITSEKNELRKQIEARLREMYHDIPESKLKTDDRETFNLKKRDTQPTPAPIAGHAPAPALEKTAHLVQTLRIVDPANPHTQSMPKGQKVLLERFVGNAGLAEATIPFGNAETVSRFLHRVLFTASEVGKTVYYRCRYINTRGLQGPSSAVISAVIA